MGNWVEENTCGSCAEYEYEGDNQKGYCKRRRSYYYPDDSCSYWESNGTFPSGSSGCFLTSACCEYKGFSDDCYELQTMRAFRDNHLKKTDSGRKLIELYYEEAPAIVEKINASSMREKIYEWMWEKIQMILELMKGGSNEDATIEYTMMMYRLKNLDSLVLDMQLNSADY